MKSIFRALKLLFFFLLLQFKSYLLFFGFVVLFGAPLTPFFSFGCCVYFRPFPSFAYNAPVSLSLLESTAEKRKAQQVSIMRLHASCLNLVCFASLFFSLLTIVVRVFSFVFGFYCCAFFFFPVFFFSLRYISVCFGHIFLFFFFFGDALHTLACLLFFFDSRSFFLFFL